MRASHVSHVTQVSHAMMRGRLVVALLFVFHVVRLIVKR